MNTGRVVIVTGGSQGIGKAIAEAFGENGDQVIITGRTQEKLDKVVEDMSNTVGMAADVTSEEDVKRLTDEVLEKYGRIDVLVNNAGIQRIHSVEEFPKEEWDLVLNTILTGTFLMTKYSLPSMQENSWGV